MTTRTTRTDSDAAREALRLLDEAWAYYTPEPPVRLAEEDEDRPLFQYYQAA